MAPLKPVNMQALFDRVLKYIINILILYIILILVLGLGKTIFTSTQFMTGRFLEFDLSGVVTDILTFLVIIELFKSFVGYFKAERFRLHTMLDPALIFIVRELIVKLYCHESFTGPVLVGFAAVILCIGVIRTLAVVYSPDDEKG